MNVGFANFGLFFRNQTGEKHHIPFIIWEASLSVKKWFIAGVMDGDGWISKTNRNDANKNFQYRIGVGGVEEGWIYEFEKLLQGIGVKTCLPEVDISGFRKKPMVRFSIKIDSFVSKGLFFTINRKQNRLREYIEKRSTT
jgi:intein/homing endonuclease